MIIKEIETLNQQEIELVRAYIMAHKVSDGYPSWHRCVHKSGEVDLWFGYDLDSEMMASAGKHFACVKGESINEFRRFCEEKGSPMKLSWPASH